MAVNLLELAKNYLTDSVVGQVSTMLGENQQNTQKALNGALPAILSGLVQKSAEPGGTSAIMDMVGEVMSPNRAAGDVITPAGGMVSQLSNVLMSGTQSDGLLSMGSGIIQSLFGSKTAAIAGALSSYSGIKQSSASSLMSIAGPILLSVLGKKLADDGTGVTGVAGLLSSQSTNSQSAIPSGFGALLGAIPGLSFLGGLSGKLGDLTSPSVNTTTRVAAPAVPITRPAPTYVDDDERPSGGGNRWLPWLLLALGAVGLFYFLRSCRNDGNTSVEGAADSVSTSINNTATDVTAAADSAGSSMGAAMDSAGSAIGDATTALGAFFKRKLPSGYELNVPENGIENNLIKFIEDKNVAVDKTSWFNFGRLVFDTGKATLMPDSKEEVKNIAEILKAFPDVAIKIGGYTDNTGSADLNKTLSQDRANTVVSELVQLGIAESRLQAEGYGSEFPVATNDTEAGRTQNRRIAVRVTKK